MIWAVRMLTWFLAVASGVNVSAPAEKKPIQTREDAARSISVELLRRNQHRNPTCALNAIEVIAWNHRELAIPHSGLSGLAVGRDPNEGFRGVQILAPSPTQ